MSDQPIAVTFYAHCIHCATGHPDHEDVHTRPCDASASGRRPAERPCVGDRVLKAPILAAGWVKPESAPR